MVLLFQVLLKAIFQQAKAMFQQPDYRFLVHIHVRPTDKNEIQQEILHF